MQSLTRHCSDTKLHVLHYSLMVVMLQDAVGVGNHAANLIFSTTSAGSSGVLQDWLIIDSTGLANFTGDHKAYCNSSCPLQQ